jgi:hypothetical protein
MPLFDYPERIKPYTKEHVHIGHTGNRHKIFKAFLEDFESLQYLPQLVLSRVTSVNAIVTLNQKAAQNVATLGLAGLPSEHAPASG